MKLHSWTLLCQRLTLGSALLFSPLFSQLALAQPEVAPRAMVQTPPKPPLTAEALQKLTGEPTLITFSGQDVPLKDIVALFRKAANREVSQAFPVMEVGGKPISVNWKDVPYWTAAQEVEKLTGLRWSAQNGGLLNLHPAGTGQGSGLGGLVVADTPYIKVVANTLTHSNVKTVEYGPQDSVALPQDDSIYLSLTVYLDPKLRTENNGVRVFGARTSVSKATLPGLYSSSSGVNQGGPLIVTINLSLNRGIQPGTRIATLNGKIQARVELTSETFKVDDLIANPKDRKAVGNDELLLENAIIDGQTLKLSLTAFQPIPPDGNVFGMRQIPSFYRNPFGLFGKVRVFDGQRRELPGGGNSMNGGREEGGRRKTSGQFPFNLFGSGGPNAQPFEGPFSMEWTVPTEMGLVEIPFEMRDFLVP
ncbi:hypothetical protein EON80_07385 [bacterium]|nr:MAG: hypothetical protein EON80_07385 [bacterium]